MKVEKEYKKKKPIGIYAIGSIALGVCAFAFMPKIIDSLSSKIFNNYSVTKGEYDDDLGPVIVRKEKETGDKANGNV